MQFFGLETNRQAARQSWDPDRTSGNIYKSLDFYEASALIKLILLATTVIVS